MRNPYHFSYYRSVSGQRYDYPVSGRTILIVEDEMITALDLRNQLTRLGYQVAGLARSGAEAVRLALEFQPDLVLMDINLAGGMSGIEASRRIWEASKIPIVYVTSYPRVFLESPAQMQTPGLCVSKPISIPELQGVIQIALH